MSKFFKSKHKFIMSLSALFLVITLATGSFAYASGGMVAGEQSKSGKDSSSQAAEEESSDEEEAPPEETPAPDPESFKTPDGMRGAFLVPGVDFLTAKDASEETVKKEIDAALKSAQELTINSIIVDTVYNDKVIYQTQDAAELNPDFDIMGYIVEAARKQDFYTYAIFDASMYQSHSAAATLVVGAATVDKLSGNLSEFAEKYALDGILIDGYTTKDTDASYNDYLNIGAAMGFDNFMRQSPAAIVKTSAAAIRKGSPATQVGLLSDAVWENESVNSAGSATEASYTALSDGNADTKSYVEKGLVDFVALKAYTSTTNKSEPFSEVVNWWASVTASSHVPLYVVHATDKLFSDETGWNSKDQLVQQVSAVDEAGVAGSIFNDLHALAANPQDVATNLMKYYNNEYTPARTEVPAATSKPAAPAPAPAVSAAPTAPASSSSSSANEDDNWDGTGVIETDEEVTETEMDTDEAVDPSEEDATTDDTGEVGNDSTDGDVAETDEDFVWEVGYISDDVVPQTIPMVKNLGQIMVNKDYNSTGFNLKASLQTVAATKFKDGAVVQVTADQAITYPPKTKDNIPTASYYPLPKGTVDTVVGSEISYTSWDKKKYTFVLLESGVRVETKDLQVVSGNAPSNNKISKLGIKSDKDYTYITLNNTQRPAYAVKYTATDISFNFKNTSTVPSSQDLAKNPMFTKASWTDSTLTLEFVKSGGFMGYKCYYNQSGNLVLRFNNPPASIKGAKIAVDAGHGGKDPGNLAPDGEYNEDALNKLIANELVTELESRGATVMFLDADNIQGPERRTMAEKWQPDLFVSVHCNSAPNKDAAGTEAYYFYTFNKALAANAAKSVSGSLSTANRGAKASYYHVTLSPQFQSVLVECGFMSNSAEYKKLISSKYQTQIAVGIADSLESTIKSTYTGISGTGSSSSSSGTSTSSSSSKSSNNVEIEGIWIRDTLNILKGRSTTLAPTFYPEDVADVPVTWKSSNTSIVTVDENGKITGKAEGTAKVTVKTADGSQSSVCEVTVKPADAKLIAVKGVSLNETDLNLSVNETFLLEADIDPYDADDTSISWKSSRSAIASVSASGKVTGLKEGEAVITATAADGRKKATCKVIVQGVASATSSTSTKVDSGISLKSASDAYFDYDDYTVYPGTPVRLEIVSNAGEVIRGKDFKWESEDTDYVTVDSMGYVTGKKVGEAMIYATSNDYDLECLVIVSRDKVKPTSVDIEKSSVTVIRKGTVKLVTTVEPSNATKPVLVWSTSDSKIAKVDGLGNVTGVKAGTATITVKTKEGGYTDKCTVTVVNSAIKLEEIVMDEDLELYVDEEYQLEVELYPEDATNTDLAWKSSRPEIATVDESGNVTGIKKGTAKIFATAKNDSKIKATCNVVVLN